MRHMCRAPRQCPWMQWQIRLHLQGQRMKVVGSPSPHPHLCLCPTPSHNLGALTPLVWGSGWAGDARSCSSAFIRLGWLQVRVCSQGQVVTDFIAFPLLFELPSACDFQGLKGGWGLLFILCVFDLMAKSFKVWGWVVHMCL